MAPAARAPQSPEYRAWIAAKGRCYCPTNKRYAYYGGRGIRVCDEWLNDFSAFLSYVGPRPSQKHSLDRFPDVNGNYEPGNVRWATSREQMNNRRTNHYIEHDGERLSIGDWAARRGVPYKKFYRLYETRGFEYAIADDAARKTIPKQRRPHSPLTATSDPFQTTETLNAREVTVKVFGQKTTLFELRSRNHVVAGGGLDDLSKVVAKGTRGDSVVSVAERTSVRFRVDPDRRALVYVPRGDS